MEVILLLLQHVKRASGVMLRGPFSCLKFLPLKVCRQPGCEYAEALLSPPQYIAREALPYFLPAIQQTGFRPAQKQFQASFRR